MRAKKGDILFCERFGEVIVVDFHNGWPCCRQRGRLSLILCDELAEEVRKEAVTTLTKRWGVSRKTVWLWRKSLGIGRTNPGTRKMRIAQANRVLTPKLRLKAAKACRTKQARKRRSETALTTWKTGKLKHTKWTKKELAIINKYTEAEVAKRTGRTLGAIRNKRQDLKRQQ